MKILKIKHENKVGRSGKPFESCQILTRNSQGEETWISGFGGDITHTWSDGDDIDVVVTKNDKGYWNFTLSENSKPSPDKKLLLLQEIDRKLDLLLQGDKTTINKQSGTTYQFDTENYATGQIEGSEPNLKEILTEDIPFN